MIRTVNGLAVLSTLATLGCGREVPEPDFAVQPSRLVMAPVGWEDEDFIWYPVSVLNTTYYPLELRGIEVIGEGAQLLEWVAPGQASNAPVVLPLRESITIQIRVLRPEGSRTVWATKEFNASLEFDVGGTGITDLETGEPDLSAYRTVSHTVPLVFSINCDLDNDGYDAEACAGLTGDCDDSLDSVSPDALEYCDGYDNNCDDIIDNGCTPLE